MDFLNGKIKTLYFKYLAAAFGSALITSIYSIVDMAMVGQYHGPEGTAALAVVAPVWNVIYSLGLLMGIGGSILFSTIRGRENSQTERSNEYFTASMLGAAVLAIIVWVAIIFFDRELLLFFGAEESTLSLAKKYVLPIKFVIPCFLFTQALAAYLRNDGNPALATAGVLAGGIFNIFGDYFFVFVCDMGASNGGRRCNFCFHYVCAFFDKEEFPAAGLSRKAAEQMEGNLRDRIFYVLYRHCHGDSDNPV